MRAPVLQGEVEVHSVMSVESQENMQDNVEPTAVKRILKELAEEEKKRAARKVIADGINRSERSVAMRVKDTTDAKLDEIER